MRGEFSTSVHPRPARLSVGFRIGLSSLVAVVAFLSPLATITDPGSQVAYAQQVSGLPAGCNVDPRQTSDPAAVAAAQAAISRFLADVNRTWSMEGYGSSAQMIGTEGNNQTDWYDQTLALACGRLIGGYAGKNWVAGRGWVHAR
jgi:hypothetical protein